MTIEAEGFWGIAGFPNSEKITFRNSNIHAKGKSGAICDFTSITLEGCYLVLPEGGSITNKDILDANGDVATEVVIERDVPGGSGIEGVATSHQKDNARYNLNGQKVDHTYKGIVIEQGKKSLVK